MEVPNTNEIADKYLSFQILSKGFCHIHIYIPEQYLAYTVFLKSLMLFLALIVCNFYLKLISIGLSPHWWQEGPALCEDWGRVDKRQERELCAAISF